MRAADRSDLWWRGAVFYCLDVEKFQDSDGDGVGDFAGLTERMDYLAELGITCIWLMPFQPTANRDDGYDITDFYGVDRRLGDLGTFVEMLRVAHDRGIRVIVDLVVNHTSDRHPWFVDARRSRNSRYRDYYVWSDEPLEEGGDTVFPGVEDGVWQWEERTEQYYLHHFYSHQPDLNVASPAVRAEIARIVGFWLELGIDGFRIDAVPFLITPPGAADADDPHGFLRELRRFASRRSGGIALLGEVGLPYDDQLEYFGTRGRELDLQLDFTAAQAAFLAFVRHDAAPLVKALGGRPKVDASQGWALFLRNHDELSLELLADDEREEVFEALAPDPAQRVYGRGIVRRLAPMLEGDPRRIRLAYALLFSLPGAPILYYGEEIGMGEHPEAGERIAVRTPMQWRHARGGGFSTAPESRLVTPVTTGGYGPEHVNVADQRHDAASLWSFVARLIARYRSAPEIAWGEVTVHDSGDPGVLVHSAASDEATFIGVHNLCDEPRTVEIAPGDLPDGARVLDLIEGGPVDRDPDSGVRVVLDGYGFRWLRALSPDAS